MNIAANDSVSPLRHSKLGLVSTGFAIIATIVWFFPLVISLIFKAGESGNLFSFVNFIVVPALYLTGLILGVVGAFRKGSKKLFVIIGIIYNSICLIILAALLLMFLLVLYVAANTPWR